MNKYCYTPEVISEWERVCERLKKSGYDLSKIRIAVEDPEMKKRKNIN